MELIYKNPLIYMIAGKAQHGKTTTSKIIIEEYKKRGKKVARLYHAKYIKDYAMDYFDWDGREKTKPRELLLNIGTELIRKKLGKEYFFINRITEDIEILSYFFDIIVIDDARLKIEIEAQRKNFEKTITINIKRKNFDNKLTEEQKNHLTEIDLDDYEQFDYIIINDAGIEDLREKISKIIKENEDVE